MPTMERVHSICVSAENAAGNKSFKSDKLLKNFKMINSQMRVGLVRSLTCPPRLRRVYLGLWLRVQVGRLDARVTSRIQLCGAYRLTHLSPSYSSISWSSCDFQRREFPAEFRAQRRTQGPYIFMKGYTSFGRHFTTTEKLEVVTDSLMFLLLSGAWKYGVGVVACASWIGSRRA